MQDYNSSVASRKSVYKAIAGAGKSLQFYQHSPRMVPQGLDPVCHKMFITVAEQSSKAADKKSKAKKKTQSVGDVSVLLKKGRVFRLKIFRQVKEGLGLKIFAVLKRDVF